MRKTLFVILILSIITGGTLLASPWGGGYRIAFDGFVIDSIATTEYLSIELNLRLFPSGPSLQSGLAMSAGEHLLVTFGTDVPLFRLQKHPFESLFRRSSAYAPTLGFSTMFDTESMQFVTTSMVLQPFLFDFSDKQVGILGIHVLWDIDTGSWGWGLRLFEISHYLW